MPDHLNYEVRLRLSGNLGFNDLGLKWYAIPAVSNVEFHIGGLVYTAAPFNGWYADTEIMRNLLDQDRFNLSQEIYDSCDENLKISLSGAPVPDIAAIILNAAIVESFKDQCVSIAQHNLMLERFYNWYNKEL